MGKVLVACEESQVVTSEMRAIGIEAWSCDILPTSGLHPEWHIQEDVGPLLGEDWDMIIAFPPCTHLASSGARHFAAKQADGRQQQGIDFFMMFTTAKCNFIAIENPVGIMSRLYRKPDQIVHPYWFGDPFQKATCLWLKNLPLLLPTNPVNKEEDKVLKAGYRMAGWMYEASLLKPAERAMARSKTFPGVAAAMASQWGRLLE